MFEKFTDTAKQAITAAQREAIGIDGEEIRRRADESFGPGRFQFPRPVFTPRALRALKLSLRETLELRQHSIGTEHLLLGLLAEGEGTAVKVLDALDVDRTELRPAILARISPQGS